MNIPRQVTDKSESAKDSLRYQSLRAGNRETLPRSQALENGHENHIPLRKGIPSESEIPAAGISPWQDTAPTASSSSVQPFKRPYQERRLSADYRIWTCG